MKYPTKLIDGVLYIIEENTGLPVAVFDPEQHDPVQYNAECKRTSGLYELLRRLL